MSDGIDEKEDANVVELNKLGNLNQAIQKFAGKRFVLAYIREEDDTPVVIPSEEVQIPDMVYLAEILKTIALSQLGIFSGDDE